MVFSSLRVDDELPFVGSVAEGLVMLVSWFRTWCLHYCMLLCMPAITPEDVTLIVRHFSARLSRLMKSTTKSISDSESTLDTSGFIRQTDFDTAVRWLQRPCLSVSFVDQLVLYGLHARGVSDDDCDTAASTQALPDRDVERVKCEASLAHLELTPAAARSELPLKLAGIDPAFATAHPRLTPALPADSGPHLFLRLLERRLPRDLDERILRLQQQFFGLSACTTALLGLAALKSNRGRGRHRRSLALASVGSAAMTFYLGLLARGLPAWLHACFMLWIGGKDSLSSVAKAVSTTDPTASLFRLLARAFLPRVSQPLFVVVGRSGG